MTSPNPVLNKNSSSKLRTLFFLFRNNFTLNPYHITFLLRHSLMLWLLNIEVKKQFKSNYGDFNWDRNCRPHRLMNPTSEGGAILGEVVLFAKTTIVENGQILLAGDRNEVKEMWSQFFPNAKITNAGIHDMDYFWDYENDPPAPLKDQRFKLIISQATLEHLINPYKHFYDLASLVADDGYLIIHTVLPGFFYHRVPIDCFRFYPDWFEIVSEKLGLEIVDKQIQVFNITYKFKRSSTL